MKWDVFISHASEDKEEIAEPLATMLENEGLKVWYDRFTLKLGDSIKESIEEGLMKSRFGVVILSPSFLKLKRYWPTNELTALIAREVDDEKVILPIWHDVTREDIVRYSLILADRYAVKTSEGLIKVVAEILRVVSHPKPAMVHSSYNILTQELVVNGKVEAQGYTLIHQDRTYLPLGLLLSAFRIPEDDIVLDPLNREVTITKREKTVKFIVGTKSFFINDKPIETDYLPAIAEDNMIMVNPKDFAEALGGWLGFDQSNTMHFTFYR